LALVLLVGAGLLVHSFVRLLNVDPGFQPQRVLARHLSFRHPKYRSADVAFRLGELLERLRTTPGVQSAAVSSWLPIDGGRSRFAMAFRIEGRPPAAPGKPEDLTVANMSFVTPNYFRTMGIPLLKGRDFLPGDLAADAPAAKIVSESFVRKFLPGDDPLGKRVAGGEIVGMVKDTREAALDTRAEPHLYHAGIHTGPLGLRAATLAIQMVGDPARFASSVEAEVLAWDKDQPPYGVITVRQILSASVAQRRFQMMLIGLFAALALLLAALGIYSVMAYLVTQRTHEIGIRMALGARPRDVLKLIVRQGMLLALTGVGIGLAGSFALTRVIASQLYEVGAADPTAFAGVSLLLAVVACFACYFPARRAAKVDPMVALRYE
jgi:putative ABC transport system permease protein